MYFNYHKNLGRLHVNYYFQLQTPIIIYINALALFCL